MAASDLTGSDRLAALSPASDQLLRAVDAAVRADGDDTQTLREAVASYVASAKTLRLPPQEMLVELKVQLHEAAQHLPAHEYNALRSRVVSWAIDDYYNDHDGGRDGGRDGDGGQ